MATRWLTVGDDGPEVAAPGGLPARVQHRRAGLVAPEARFQRDEDATDGAQLVLHVLDDRRQVEARTADPVAQRAAVEVEPLPLEDPGLAVEWQVISELGHDDPCDQPFRRQPARHDMLGRARHCPPANGSPCTTACEHRRQAYRRQRVTSTWNCAGITSSRSERRRKNGPPDRFPILLILEQRRQLRRRHPHHPVPHLRPDEPFGMPPEPVAGHASSFQPLVNQDHPCLVPDQQLDPVRPFRTKDEDGAAERVAPEHLLRRQRQPVDPLAARAIEAPLVQAQWGATGHIATNTFTGPPWPSITAPPPAPPGSPASAVLHQHRPRPGSRHLR